MNIFKVKTPLQQFGTWMDIYLLTNGELPTVCDMTHRDLMEICQSFTGGWYPRTDGNQDFKVMGVHINIIEEPTK